MRPRATIFVKLLVALVIPAVALFALFAVVAYEVSRKDLDAELGHRLEAIAASAATQLRGKYLVDLQPGDEGDRAVLAAQQKLQPIAEATGVQIAIFNRSYESRFDSAGHVAIGTHYFRAELDRAELERLFAQGRTVSSVTFDEGGKTYKSGYAPVRASETDPTIVLALGAQAPAGYFRMLDSLRDRLLFWGGILAAVSVLAAVVASLLVTRNVRRLAAAAERIGAGDLNAPVIATSRDELGVLAEVMDRMRGQLAERDARMQQMLAGIAHEVRNPLAGMTLFADILKDELPAGDERRGHVDKIQRELGYLERVVNDFLEYARRPKPELGDVELSELLDEVAQLATTSTNVKVTRTDLHARADRGQLRRALLNLARNAVQHAADGDVVLAASKGDELRISVTNRGPDISPETSGKLFEPFFTTREKGTGLGLAFVREIAADHGGRVEVASAGGETTFTIVLPL